MATQNRGRASAAARRAAQLEQLNNIGSNRSEFDTAGMFNIVENDAANFIQRVKANIQSESDMVVTGEIENIKAVVSSTGIDIMIPAHLSYQDKGVNGSVNQFYNTPYSYKDKKPPAAVFAEWIKTKNIQLRNEEFYGGNPSSFEEMNNDTLVNRAAYAMREKVYRDGFKPRNIYSKEIPQLISDVQQTVTDFVTNFLTQTITNGNGNQTRTPIN